MQKSLLGSGDLSSPCSVKLWSAGVPPAKSLNMRRDARLRQGYGGCITLSDVVPERSEVGAALHMSLKTGIWLQPAPWGIIVTEVTDGRLRAGTPDKEQR